MMNHALDFMNRNSCISTEICNERRKNRWKYRNTKIKQIYRHILREWKINIQSFERLYGDGDGIEANVRADTIHNNKMQVFSVHMHTYTCGDIDARGKCKCASPIWLITSYYKIRFNTPTNICIHHFMYIARIFSPSSDTNGLIHISTDQPTCGETTMAIIILMMDATINGNRQRSYILKHNRIYEMDSIENWKEIRVSRLWMVWILLEE